MAAWFRDSSPGCNTLKRIKRPPEQSRAKTRLALLFFDKQERGSFKSTLYSDLSYEVEREIFPDETHILCCPCPMVLRPVEQMSRVSDVESSWYDTGEIQYTPLLTFSSLDNGQ